MDVIIQHPGWNGTQAVSPGRLLELLWAAGLWEWDLLPSVAPELGPWSLQALLRLGLCSGMSEVRCERGRFGVTLDVKHFHPEELAMRVQDGFLEVQGHHGERPDAHGCVSREFCRRYPLPPTWTGQR